MGGWNKTSWCVRFRATRGPVALVLAALLVGVAGHSSPAIASCNSSERRVFFVEFAQGSSTLASTLAGHLAAYLQPSIYGQQYVASYYILASGDLAEGAEWDKASVTARSADQKLGEARSVAIKAMLNSLPPQLRSKSITATVRENRQVFTETELLANPLLNPRLRAGIVADIQTREPKRRKGQPIPTC